MSHYRHRLRYHHCGLLEVLRRPIAGPSWHSFCATSTAASTLSSAAAPSHTPQPSRLRRLLSAGPQAAKSRKTHSSQPVARGFVLRGLSGACRQPKLFTLADQQHSATLLLKAAIWHTTRRIAHLAPSEDGPLRAAQAGKRPTRFQPVQKLRTAVALAQNKYCRHRFKPRS